LLALAPTLTDGASSDDLGFEIASNLPAEVWEKILASEALRGYRLSARLNPFYLHADFDGDGRRDTAVLIQHSATNQNGMAVFHANRQAPFILGSGPAVEGTGYASVFNSWQVMVRGPVQMGADETPPPTLKGDALVLSKLEASSVIMYWTGSAYATYWQGD
jgi:hypothetical protein